MKSLYTAIAEAEAANQPAALCIVVSTSGSTPRKPGAKMLVYQNGSIAGSVGGGSLEKQIIADALDVMRSKQPKTFTHALVHDHGMCCGGTVEIYIEPLVTKKPLFVFGAGHIGRALAQFAHALNFNVTVIDERDEMVDGLAETGLNVIHRNHARAFPALAFTADTFVCVITHDHAFDREIVAYCAKQPHAYLGMIGSQRKVEMAKKTFRAGNLLTEHEMAAIDWPMGINIKVETPEEIAIAILARLIDVRGQR